MSANAVPKIVDITRYRGPNKAGAFAIDAQSSPAGVFLDNAIETMARVRAERGRGVFALMAPHRGAGTTHTVNLLARELALQLNANVAVIPTEALKGADPKRLPQGFMEHTPHIWTAVPDAMVDQMPDFALENLWISPGENNFDFVLIDCPAVNGNLLSQRWASAADGAFLVVEAGVTRIDQIEAAERSLRSASGRGLKGMILNRRTYPIPGFLYRFL